ncbi:MAG TPA: ABC transporter ATP-binding protein [Methanomicrobiales archaeon]|nr:ABC transporter ATP-binding protein [Methanomicrobiales archaeon]
MVDDTHETDVVLSFENVDKRYGDGEDGVLALSGIDIDIEQGEFISFVGPSGCGKTTLLHLTAGLIDPTGGSIRLDGVDVKSDRRDPDDIGLIFQHPVLLNWRTVLKNILLPVQVMTENGVLDGDVSTYRTHARDLISLVGLDGFEDAYPQELSGGMQQRVSICQSLIYDPRVLLMDEPFGSLDALTKDQLNVELLDIWRETRKTILFITHDLEEAVFLSDRIVVLGARPGHIVDVIDVDLDRPRTETIRSHDRFHDLVSETYKYFRES